MGRNLRLTAADGHRFGAYCAEPSGTAKGGVVVLQEIFGVNHHIRNVCDNLAERGYLALAPALFDRKAPGFESGYSPDEIAVARKFLTDLDWQAFLADTEAAVSELRRSTMPIGVMGFCIGGSVAYLASARIDGVSSAICYYGGAIIQFVDEQPRCPVLMHFGNRDHTIPLADVEKIRHKRPECEIHLYPAGHGFNRDARSNYHPESAQIAWRRSLDWLEESVCRP